MAKHFIAAAVLIVLSAARSYAQIEVIDSASLVTSLKRDSVVSAAVPPRTVAEKDSTAARQLAEFVTTATRTEKKIGDAGRSVSVITSEEIRNSGANSLAELLSLAEGVYITGAQQNFGSNQSVFIRGTNSNQSVVLIDGIPVSDPSTPAGALDFSELSLSDIDRVEIVRGSHSTLYGSSAIGGVINIITSKKQKDGLGILASGTAGSFGEETSIMSQNIGMNYTCKGGFYSGLSFYNSNVNGIDATLDTSTVPGTTRDKDGMDRFDYGAKIGYKTNRWDLYLSRKNVEKSADIDDREFDDDDNYKLNFSRKMLSYGLSCKVDSGFIISLNGGKSSMERISLNDSSVVDASGNYDQSYYEGTYTGETFANDLQLNFMQKGYSIVLGGGMNEQTMNQTVYSYSPWGLWESDMDSLDLASRTNSFFLLADLNGSLVSEKTKAFSVAIGFRSNKNNTFGSSLTYQVSPVVKVSTSTSLYANISSGYNAPSLYQLHSPDKDFTSSISRGNINLRPETSVTREFGVYQELNKHTGIRIGYHQTVVDDIIEYVYLWNGTTPVASLTYLDYRGDTYMNLGKLTTEGIEMEAHGNIGTKFLLAGNFSYLRGRHLFSFESVDTVKSEGNHVQLYTNGEFVSVKDVHTTGLTRRPVTANLSLTYSPNDNLFIKTIVKYISKKNDVFVQSDYTLAPIPVGAYTLVDLIAGAAFNGNLSGLVRIENIFNLSYSEIRGFSSRGRGIYFTIHYSF